LIETKFINYKRLHIKSGKEGDYLNLEDVELGFDVSSEDTPRKVGDCEADGRGDRDDAAADLARRGHACRRGAHLQRENLY